MTFTLPRVRWAFVLALVLVAEAVLAGDGAVIEMPQPGVVRKSGLNLRIDTTWVTSPGYRPLHVTVETTNGLPSPKDRTLTIEFRPQDSSGQSHRTKGEIVLFKGEVTATSHLLVPQTAHWYNASVTTTENGVGRKDLTVNWANVNRISNGFELTKPTMLVIDSAAPTLAGRSRSILLNQAQRNAGQQLAANTYELPDIRNVLQWTGSPNYVGGSNFKPVDDATIIEIVADASGLELLPPEQLPQQWIAYSGVDCIFLSTSELLNIRRKFPLLADALKQWTATGGNLIVYGMGHDYSRLAQLEAMLELTVRSSREPLDRWRPSNASRSSDPKKVDQLASVEWEQRRKRLANHPDSNLKKSAEELRTLLKQWQEATINNADWQPMRVLDYGHGTIVALPETDPFPGTSSKWDWLEATIKPYHSWNTKVGIELENGDPQFLAYSIPDVGLPPVNTFRLLITLFVIVIGPVNYLLLKRRKRLFLLLVTVPLGAAFVTMSLFSYALIKDGLSMRTRVHSFSSLDQRAGMASSWSRQTYFASLPPSQGLVFPESATVYSIWDNNWNTRRSQRTANRLLQWNEDQQQLRRGYVASRTTTEFLVTQAEAVGDKELKFSRKAPDKPLQVTNKLGTEVLMLLAITDDGQSYWTEDLASESVTALKPLGKPSSLEYSTAINQFKQVAQERRPVDPFAGQMSGWFFSGRRRWSARSDTRVGAGVLNRGRYLALSISPKSSEGLKPGEFLAITERSPFVPLGVDTESEEASFHMVRGRFVSQ